MMPEPARAGDLEAVIAVVEACGLPTAGIADAFPAAYVVVRLAGSLVAVAGLETYGATGLLRSVAVTSPHRSTGLGARLVENRIEAARVHGLEAVYLLTTTAAAFFRHLGFDEADRSSAPAEILRSSEFASICPASATCLVWRL